MGAAKYIVNRILFVELCVSDSVASVKVWSACCKGNEVLFAEPFRNIGEELKQWKYAPALLLITGESLVSKNFQVKDSFYQRITDNPELLWEVQGEPDAEEQTITFLRKDRTEELFGLLSRNHIILLKQWIREQGSFNEKKLVLDFYKEYFKVSNLCRDMSFADTLSRVVYHKIRLPVLLLFFIIVLGNFVLNTYIRKEYEVVQSELHMNKRYNTEQQAHSKKEGNILSRYRSVPAFPVALMADRIASYVPPQLTLHSLRLFPLEHAESAFSLRSKEQGDVEKKIRVKGETPIPGCVSLFTQYLESDKLFSCVRINSLAKKGDSSGFVFELEVEPGS